ncbi:uncharacterized protein [Temnothorax longispinosus]|uniref:uncharacterized protein n=1 Tax=Temnothorax longispinosus TaxID=300112 RepID=UPI003A99D222
MEEKKEESKGSKNSEKKYQKENKKTFKGGKNTENRYARTAELSETRNRARSQGSIADNIKKRRREQESEEIKKAEKEIIDKFDKERRLSRSPPNKVKKEEEEKESMETGKMLKKILTKLEDQEKERKKDKEELMKEIQDLRKEYRKSEMIWEKLKTGIEKRVKQLEERMEEAEKRREGEREYNELLKKMKEIERKNELEERKKRRNNIIIKGAEIEDGGERREKIGKLLKKITKKEVEVDEVQIIGRRENKMTLVRMNRWEDKREIMINRKKMGIEKKIYIDDDMTVTERKIQGQLWSIVKEEREKGKRATLGYQKILLRPC